MRYADTCIGEFVDRPNRFIANVIINGELTVCHVKNTGRCRELLVKGATVVLERSANPSRKTLYDVIGVYKGEVLFNIDSVAPNACAAELFKEHPLRREVTYKGSRFDLYLEDTDTFVEVKGVTLENGGVASFPDAPTLRGAKHLAELADAVKNGHNACVLFVLQFSGARYFTPNQATDPTFASRLREAREQGVRVMAVECAVTEDSLSIVGEVKVVL